MHAARGVAAARGGCRRSGQLPRHVRRRLARRYVARLPGGRWRRIRHAGGPTDRDLRGCPSPGRQAATAGSGVVSLAAPYSKLNTVLEI